MDDGFRILLQNYMRVVPDTNAIAIFSTKGELIFAQSINNGQFSNDLTPEIKNLISRIIQPLVSEMQDITKSGKFRTEVIEGDICRIVNTAFFNIIVTFVLDNLAFVDKMFPYAYLLVEKIYRLIENKIPPTLTIPMIGNFGNTKLITEFVSGHIYKIKVILIGESNVGKTSLVLQFTHQSFANDYRPTIGLNLLDHKFSYLGNEMHMNIWDIASHKHFKRTRPSYYAGSNFALLVFDLTNRASFEKVTEWRNEIRNFCGNIPVILIGNKLDLKDQRQIHFEQGLKLAKELDCPYMETSAMNSENVEDAFFLIACQLINKSLSN